MIRTRRDIRYSKQIEPDDNHLDICPNMSTCNACINVTRYYRSRAELRRDLRLVYHKLAISREKLFSLATITRESTIFVSYTSIANIVISLEEFSSPESQ